MVTVGIRELKARLSAYVRTVRAGAVVAVTDNGTIVAELRRPADPRSAHASRLRYDEAVAAGRLVAPAASGDRSWLDADVKLPRGTVERLLDAERGDR